MAGKPLFVLLLSGEHEKIQMAAMTASLAAVSERPTTILVGMNALLAFERGLAPEARYHGGRMSEIMTARKVPDAVELFGQGKMLGEMTMWACSMALDVLAWTTDNLSEDLFDGPMGLTKFLGDAEAGQLVTF